MADNTDFGKGSKTPVDQFIEIAKALFMLFLPIAE